MQIYQAFNIKRRVMNVTMVRKSGTLQALNIPPPPVQVCIPTMSHVRLYLPVSFQENFLQDLLTSIWGFRATEKLLQDSYNPSWIRNPLFYFFLADHQRQCFKYWLSVYQKVMRSLQCIGWEDSGWRTTANGWGVATFTLWKIEKMPSNKVVGQLSSRKTPPQGSPWRSNAPRGRSSH